MVRDIDINKVIENDFESSLYERKIKEVILYLDNFGPTPFWKIIKEVGGSERRMLRLINEMVLNKMINFDSENNCFYTKKEKEENDIEKLRDMLEEIWKEKPDPTLFFDQRPVTMETTIKRVEYLLKNNDCNNKKIVILGDDDLTSVALALCSKKSDVTVLEVDRRLVDLINNLSKKYNLNLEAYEFNATSELDSKFLHKFDVFMTDPTPEVIPFTLFMNNAVKLVKEEGGIIYTSIYSSAMDKTLALQNVINSMNLYITDIIPKFTSYQALYHLYRKSDIELMNKYNIEFDNNSICFTESLFRMETTKTTKTLPLDYTMSDIFGKATKRVIGNNKKDIAKKDDYIEEVIKITEENKNKKYHSE